MVRMFESNGECFILWTRAAVVLCVCVCVRLSVYSIPIQSLCAVMCVYLSRARESRESIIIINRWKENEFNDVIHNIHTHTNVLRIFISHKCDEHAMVRPDSIRHEVNSCLKNIRLWRNFDHEITIRTLIPFFFRLPTRGNEIDRSTKIK